MTEQQREHWQIIQELCKDSWKRLSERRSHIWHYSLTLWTALAALTGLIFADKVPISRSPGSLITVFLIFVAGCALIILHILWLGWQTKRYMLERKMAFHYEDRLRELSGVRFSTELQQEIEKTREGLGKGPLDWATWSQVLVTVFLCLVGTIAAIIKFFAPNP